MTPAAAAARPSCTPKASTSRQLGIDSRSRDRSSFQSSRSSSFQRSSSSSGGLRSRSSSGGGGRR